MLPGACGRVRMTCTGWLCLRSVLSFDGTSEQVPPRIATCWRARVCGNEAPLGAGLVRKRSGRPASRNPARLGVGAGSAGREVLETGDTRLRTEADVQDRTGVVPRHAIKYGLEVYYGGRHGKSGDWSGTRMTEEQIDGHKRDSVP